MKNFFKRRKKENTSCPSGVCPAPISVDTSLPKTQGDIKLEANLNRLAQVHKDFTDVLNAITGDMKKTVGGG